MEPFDEALSAKVNTLSDQVDETTERVVECRKSIPTAFAQAVHRRAEAMGALVNAKEEQRRRRLRKSKPYSRFSALTRGRPLHSMLCVCDLTTLSRYRRERPRSCYVAI